MAINLKQIEAFRAVMSTGSVTQGAELLNVSQPAISRLVGDLERHIGFLLFTRRHRKLIPTEEAQILQEQVERVYLGVGHIEATAEALKSFSLGSLRVITMPVLGSRMLPAAIAAFQRAHPDVNITLEIQPRIDITEAIRSLLFDLAVIILPVRDPAIDSRVFARAEVSLLLPPNHRLADKAVVDVADLAGERFISFSPSSYFRSLIDEIFSSAGVMRDLHIETRTSEAMFSLVSSGVGVSLLAPVILPEEMTEKVIIRQFRPAVAVEIGVIWPSSRPLSRLAERFAATVQDCRFPGIEYL